MAITIVSRPRLIAYMNDNSPSVAVYSTWNASESRGAALYGFDIQNSADLNSTIEIETLEIGSNTLLSRSIHKPFKLGTFFVDLSSYVKQYLVSEFSFTGSERNVIDVGGSIRFYVQFRQVLADGTPQALQSEENRPIFLIRAAKQYTDAIRPNMLDYTMFPDELPEAQRGKFLTLFDQPTIFPGYTRTVSFIWDNYIRGNEITVTQIDRDINRNQITNTSDTLDPSCVSKLNILKIEEPGQDAYYVDAYLTLGESQAMYYVDPGYVDAGYTEIN